MSNLALNLLIDAKLITASGKVTNLALLSETEVTLRVSQYIKKRKETVILDLKDLTNTQWVNAFFSTSSTKITNEKLLSSALIYQSIIIDDPVFTSLDSISLTDLQKGLGFYSWAFEMIKAGFIKTIPISHLNKPSSEIPFLISDDAFKSSIPDEIHDYIHSNAILKSVVRDNRGRMLILHENAEISKRAAINVSFKNDEWHKGVSLYLFQHLKNGTISWDENEILDYETFKIWAYQVVNQAMRARLIQICNESSLASSTGHTYITESTFESNFMAMSGSNNHSLEPISAKFLQANNSFISIDSPKTILKVREKYSAAFERFNYSLQEITEELGKTDSIDFERKAKTLFQNQIVPQVDEIRDNINLIRSSSIKGALVSLTGFAAAIAIDSSIPIVSSLLLSIPGALNESYSAISQQQRLKKRPAYIWHKVIKPNK